jgi:hypothetical protein
MAKPLPAKEVERQTRALLAAGLGPDELRARLEALASEWYFPGLAWLWGPALYRRDRVRFRPFILAHWGGFAQAGLLGTSPVPWNDDLERWFAEVDRDDDIELLRRLLPIKYAKARSWRPDSAALLRELLTRLERAASPGRARVELEKFDIWGLELGEDAALALYRQDRQLAAPFILKHLPWSWFGSDRRSLWEGLLAAAVAAGDQRFADGLYQRQVPLKRWRQDALEACAQVQDPAALCALLERRHPVEMWRNLGEPFIELIERRGRDVLPYIGKHLRQVWTPWLTQGSYGRLVALARQRGWWDLWAGAVRTCARPKDFNAEVQALLDQRALPEATVRERLLLLAGVGREWNWGRFGAAQVQQLDDATAVAFHQRFPDLLRGPWKLHLQVSGWGPGLPRLTARLIAQDDIPLIDFLASRMATRGNLGWGAVKTEDAAEPFAAYYEQLKARDERAFGVRAIAVLGQIPAYAIHGYGRLIRANRLARLLFERSCADFLGQSALLGDLVEAPEIHVQALAYRILGQDDERARAAAVASLDVLIGTLLRPLHRATRLAAFAALANACHDAAAAARIAARAREALDLPDLRYPKERLLGLIATALHRHPGLRQAGEQRTVFRKAAS